MKINITKRVGDSTINAQADQPKFLDALVEASIFTSMPTVCGLCNSESVELVSNKGGKFMYVKVKCRACSATSTLGQYDGGIGGFWKKFEIYAGGPSKEVPDENEYDHQNG